MGLTLLIALVLLALSLTSWPGAALASGWVAVGLWMVSRTRSRGIVADATFVMTWPLYMALGL
jgi:hypothetical protein